MATYDEIMAALRRADAAGDTEAATRLAQMARAAKASQGPETGMAEQPEGNWFTRGLRDFGMIAPAYADFATGAGDSRAAQIGRNAGTLLNMGGESMTMGVVGDEAAAAADAAIGRGPYGERLEKYRGDERQMWQENPALAVGATVAPALIPGAGMAGLAGQAASLPGRIAAGAGAGALSSGLYGFMEGEGGAENRRGQGLASGGIGGIIGGAIPAIGAGVTGLGKQRAAARIVRDAAKGAPSTDELRAMGNALYQQVDDAGVQIKPQAFDAARQRIAEALNTRTGFDQLPGPGGLTPNSARVMQMMDEASGAMAQEPTAALPFKALDQMRRRAGAAAGNVTNKADQKAGMEIIEGLDDMVQRLGPDDVAGGDVQALQSAIGKARDVWSRMSKSQRVDDAIAAGEDYLSGSASGIRNQFKNMLRNPKIAKQFTEAEKAALRQVTHGNMLDQLVNLAGGGLAQMGSIGTGAALGGWPGAAAGAGAAAMQRKLAEAMVARKAEAARAAIASGALRSPEAMKAIGNAGGNTRRLIESLLFGANAVGVSR